MSGDGSPSRWPSGPHDDSALLLAAEADADDYDLALDLLDQQPTSLEGPR